MKTQEHVVAVVEPTPHGEGPLAAAQEALGRGGNATVVVLLSRQTLGDIRNFAEAEDLTLPDAREIFVDRLTEGYSAQLGGLESQIVAIQHYSGRSVLASAETVRATSIAMPETLAHRYGWRGSIARSRVPVTISPSRAA